jgi:Na+/proline symporter
MNQLQLSPQHILVLIAVYFLVLIVIAHYTSKGSDNQSFFMSNRKSPWYLIAFGMIGTSISGVTFISVPGWVEAKQMSYMQTVFGFMLGYLVIGAILMPIYYKMNLISIYTYLEKRFGVNAYKTGSAFFLLSRTVGSSIRLYLMAKVLHTFVIEPLYHINFAVTVFITILLIWSYTFKGGVKTIIWTDSLQTFFLLSSLVLTIILLGQRMNLDISGLIHTVSTDARSKIFFFDLGWGDAKNFFKQFLGGASIAIVMSGLDQDIMQKNLTCKNIKEAQTNLYTYSSALVLVNLLFLSLGILLYLYAAQNQIPIPTKVTDIMTNGVLTHGTALDTDMLFPTIALKYSTPIVGILFILGIIASSYASADSALTALTTAFCIDFLGFAKQDVNTDKSSKTRHWVHVGFSVLFFILIMFFHWQNSTAVIQLVYDSASITYGPLLGLFTFGFYTKFKIWDKYAPLVCIIAPILTYIIREHSVQWLWGYKFGFELLILNGFLTFIGLLLISKRELKTEL